MSTNVTYNGTVYPIPVQGDRNWAPPMTRFLVAVGNGSFQTTGGAFTLSADANFGTSFGLLSKYLTSVTSTPSTSGVLRLAKTDSIGWKNNGGSGNLLLAIDGTDQLTFNGVPIATPSVLTHNNIYVGNASNQPGNVPLSGDATIIDTGALTIANGAINDAKVNASAGITLSKLAALNPNICPVTDGSGFLVSSTTTQAEIAYVHGVTSDIQTQINNINSSSVPTGAITMYGAASAPTGWLLCDGSSVLRATYPALFTAIGTTWGSADGTHFNVPNLTNNVPIGSGSIAALAATAGSQTHVISSGELPTHTHTITDPTHTHPNNVARSNNPGTFSPSLGIAGLGVVNQETAPGGYLQTGGVGSASTGITVDSTGSSTAMSLVQPSIGITFIIKT